ncbi:hypothetical protein [Qipengyuania sp. SM2507]
MGAVSFAAPVFATVLRGFAALVCFAADFFDAFLLLLLGVSAIGHTLDFQFSSGQLEATRPSILQRNLRSLVPRHTATRTPNLGVY